MQIKSVNQVFLLLMSIGLSACTSVPKESTDLSSEIAADTMSIVKARSDLDLAIENEAEWLVFYENSDSRISLTEMLALAQRYAEQGDSQQAEEIAKRVSQLSLLALAQSRDQNQVVPVYPEE